MTVEYGNDGSLVVHADQGSATFTPTSNERMTCLIELGNELIQQSLPKKYVFDIMDRVGASRLMSTLRDYPNRQVLSIHDYINEEHGLSFLQMLQQDLAIDPSMAAKDLGGNRILAEYFCGILILRDDLLWAATNVVEFTATAPSLARAT